jgi:hypothetical protein
VLELKGTVTAVGAVGGASVTTQPVVSVVHELCPAPFEARTR